jgi:hypothetical protein
VVLTDWLLPVVELKLEPGGGVHVQRRRVSRAKAGVT